MAQTVSHIVEVDPHHGHDRRANLSSEPFKTLTAALSSFSGSALVKLAPGTYSVAMGETFPIILPAEVILQGQETDQGRGVVIVGGGQPSGNQSVSVALIVTGHAQVRGVTVQNPDGIGILVPSGRPLIQACRIRHCAHNGLKVTGEAQLNLRSSQIHDILGSGISLTERARGDIQDSMLQRCQYGINVTGTAAPLLLNNQCLDNQIGIVVAERASPVLRQNRLMHNQVFGLWVQGQSQPDLGHPDDAANNVMRGNGRADVQNDTPQTLLSVGNDVLPQHLNGPVSLQASNQPDPAAVPPLLLGSQINPGLPPGPTDANPPSPPPLSPGTDGQVTSRFADLHHHWASAYVEALAARHLLKGYPDGTFRPDETVNRAQFAALVASSYSHVPLSRPAVQFVDVPSSYWGYAAIARAQRQGFLSGYPDQTFRPHQPMARAQAMTAIASGLNLSPAPAHVLGIYRDRAQIPTYAIAALATATQHQLVINHPDPHWLRPLEPMTRAAVAALIYQGLVAIGQVPALAAEGVVKTRVATASFADIHNHWAAEFIQGLQQQHLVRGFDDGHFYPDRPITRAQMASLLVNAFQPAPKRPAISFRDVPPDHWAAPAIERAYRAGFLAGFPDQTFAPSHGLLRVDAWVSLVNGLTLLGDQVADSAWLSQFTDRQHIPAYATEAVAKAAHLQLIVNGPDPHRLNPNRIATRADVCAAVYRALALR